MHFLQIITALENLILLIITRFGAVGTCCGSFLLQAFVTLCGTWLITAESSQLTFQNPESPISPHMCSSVSFFRIDNNFNIRCFCTTMRAVDIKQTRNHFLENTVLKIVSIVLPCLLCSCHQAGEARPSEACRPRMCRIPMGSAGCTY